MIVLRNRLAATLQVFCQTRPQCGLPAPGMDPAFGEVAVAQIEGWNERLPRGQRVLDGLPGDRVGGRLKALSKAANAVSVEMSVSDVAMIP